MKICEKCNREMSDDLNFCSNCGNDMTIPLTNPTVYTDTYDVFLSYRRDGGETMAILLHDRLAAKGYKVFLDIESLNSGTFNTKLFDVIDKCKDFVLICSKDSLVRCANDGDWVRMEISRAVEKEKNIVPFMLRSFVFPDTLPYDIEPVRMHNGVNANSHEYFDAAIDRLAEKFLLSEPRTASPVTQPERQQPTQSKSKKTLAIAAAGVLVVAIIAVAAVFLNSRMQNFPSAGGDASEYSLPDLKSEGDAVNEITLFNDTEYTIDSLYFCHETADDWGYNIVEGTNILPGETVEISFVFDVEETNAYDISINDVDWLDEKFNLQDVYYLHVFEEDGETIIEETKESKSFTFFNETDYEVNSIHIFPDEWEYVGKNLINGITIEPHQSATVELTYDPDDEDYYLVIIGDLYWSDISCRDLKEMWLIEEKGKVFNIEINS